MVTLLQPSVCIYARVKIDISIKLCRLIFSKLNDWIIHTRELTVKIGTLHENTVLIYVSS